MDDPCDTARNPPSHRRYIQIDPTRSILQPREPSISTKKEVYLLVDRRRMMETHEALSGIFGSVSLAAWIFLLVRHSRAIVTFQKDTNEQVN